MPIPTTLPSISDQQLIDLIAEAEVQKIDGNSPNYHCRGTSEAEPTSADRTIYVGEASNPFYRAPLDMDRLREGILAIIKDQTA